MDVQRVIQDYIVDKILFGDGEKLQTGGSLRDSRILDSLGFLDIITFMEQRFGIQVADDEIIPENFDTLRKMSEFVERKIRGSVATR